MYALATYGRDVILKVVLVVLVLIAWACITDANIFRIILISLAVFLLAFTLYFFRDPERTVPSEAAHAPNVIVSPGDGKVVQIIETEEHGFFHGKVTQVSVFLSPLNVHVNRIPMTGTVRYFRYVKGEYLVAFHEKSSEKNERTEIGIENGGVKILFKQIAGFIARRIVCPIQEGDAVMIGERCGMIKFGSRVDVLFPPGSEIRVSLGEMVRGGETIIGVVRS